MKKFLISTIVVTLVATLVGVLAACGGKGGDGNNDAETAKQAITQVRSLYGDKSSETDSDYEVNSTVKVGDNLYNIVWTVSSDFADYATYVKVGEVNEESKKVTISVTKAATAFEYKLKATVTVGEATESVEFKRNVPASQAEDGQVEKSISFEDKANRVSQDANQQVWQQNEIKITNNKGGGSAIIDSANPVRFYKNSTLKIEYPGMIKLIFKTNGYDYPKDLKASLDATGLGTATLEVLEEGGEKKFVTDVTFELTVPMNEIEFTLSGGQVRLMSVDVIANSKPATDNDVIDGVKASLDIAQHNYWEAGEYALPANKLGANISWSVTSDDASIDTNGKLKITSIPSAEAELTLTANITLNEASGTKEINIKLVPLSLTNDGTADHPFTTVEAIAISKLLDSGATYDKEYYVKGFAIANGTYNADYSNFEGMYIADAANKSTTDEGALLIYRAKVGEHLTQDGFIKGSEVTFKGKIQNYYDGEKLIPELTNNPECVAKNDPQRTDAQIVEAAKEAVDLSKKTFNKKGDEVELAASHQGAALDWAVKNDADKAYIEIASGKLTVKEMPAEAKDIIIEVTISSEVVSKVEDKKEITVRLEPIQTEGDGTLEHPYTIADVLKIGKTDELVHVKGYIVEVGTLKTDYNNYEGTYIADTADKSKDDEGAIQVYRLDAKEGQPIAGRPHAKGDYVVVKGYIGEYNSKLQVTYKGSVNPQVVTIDRVADQGKSDAEKVAEALATIKNPTYKYEAGTVNLKAKEGDVDLSWKVKEGDDVSIVNNVMTIGEAATEHPVTLTVTATCGNVSTDNTKDITITVIAHTTKGTETDPYTVADIDAILSTLANKATYQLNGADKLIYVRGYVVAAGSDGTYGRDNVKIADTAEATDGTLIYGHNYDTNLPKGSDLEVGDKVLVSGYLKVYNDVKEIANSATRPVIKIVQKVQLTDAQKVEKALAAVKDTLTAITATGETVLPVSTVDDVTFTWALATDNEAQNVEITDEGKKLSVTALPTDADATVKLVVTAYCGEVSTGNTKNVTVTVKKPNGGDVSSLNIDFSTKFSTYSGSWATGYASKELSFSDLGISDATGKVIFSRVSKQSNTINDKPVVAANNSTEYVTVELPENMPITKVEFTLQAWTAKKYFKDIHIEYSVDGSTWQSCSDVTKLLKQDDYPTKDGVLAPIVVTSNANLPSTAIKVRLSITTELTNNTQIGVSSVDLTYSTGSDSGTEGGEQTTPEVTEPENSGENEAN